MSEWALLILTVLVPTAVGGFLFLGLFHNKVVKTGQNSYKIMKSPLLTLTALSIIGLIASFFHLGTPTNAFYAITGFGRSWLSNEIVFTGAFIGLACINVGLLLVKKKANSALMLVTGIVGLVAVYSMANLYAFTRVNGWDNINTYLIFFGTVFTLGPVLAASLMGTTLKGDLLTSIIKWAFAITVFGIGIQVIGLGVFSASIKEIEMINGVTAIESLSGYVPLIIFRWIVEAVGIALLGFWVMSLNKKVNYAFIYVAIIALIIGEGMNRYAFYVMGV